MRWVESAPEPFFAMFAPMAPHGPFVPPRRHKGRFDRVAFAWPPSFAADVDEVTKLTRTRLEMMRATEDGFLIAEKDLELRGGGEVLGARQSGAPEFRVAEVPGFPELLAAARDDATLLLQRDPKLTSPRGAAIRMLLYLFECDEAVRLFHAA